MTNRPKLLTPEQLCDAYPIKPRTLRYWIQNATPRRAARGGQQIDMPGNGLASAVIRIDRVTLIDEERFVEWLNSRRLGAA